MYLCDRTKERKPNKDVFFLYCFYYKEFSYKVYIVTCNTRRFCLYLPLYITLPLCLYGYVSVCVSVFVRMCMCLTLFFVFISTNLYGRWRFLKRKLYLTLIN
ncbi:hypothetical protein J3Q64DRAFT_1732534 [Phycomyces blakesleeanus]|uniref:Uncharacterized protein n=1 Tax=Phycomyces blakesleeanus TaxID=4837 RepID=A0ABR3B3H4_PHYBL